ncbi:hypothetical protein M0R04_06845 [Candidatus Dojkabacteria bacterium]|jgi:hypothetical protein|nr:hypothetical protein [Candidatus Dojkabacteria bacterium]
MKLTTQEIDYIQKVITLAKSVNIENVIIEPGKIRAMDVAQTVVLFQDKNVPDMSFGSLGLNRINDFTSRLEIARSQDGFSIDATTTGESPTVGFDVYDPNIKGPTPMWIRSMMMSGKNTKINFRSASPQTIKAPKSRASATVFGVDLTQEAVNMMIKGKAAMKADEVSFNGDKTGVSLEIVDVNGDALEYQFADSTQFQQLGKDSEFSYKYPIDSLLRVFKPNPTGTFYITARGQLMYNIDSVDVYVMARL